MNKGLEIMLKRMESHPEEFDILMPQMPTNRKPKERWDRLIGIVLDENKSGGFITEEERHRFKLKLEEVQADTFTRVVMERLFDDDSNRDKEW